MNQLSGYIIDFLTQNVTIWCVALSVALIASYKQFNHKLDEKADKAHLDLLKHECGNASLEKQVDSLFDSVKEIREKVIKIEARVDYLPVNNQQNAPSNEITRLSTLACPFANNTSNITDNSLSYEKDERHETRRN